MNLYLKFEGHFSECEYLFKLALYRLNIELTGSRLVVPIIYFGPIELRLNFLEKGTVSAYHYYFSFFFEQL